LADKWSLPGVPHKGWTCTSVDDLGTPDQVCEMRETQDIRYVHHMEHPDYPESLGVRCVCAENMENDYEGPRRGFVDGVDAPPDGIAMCHCGEC